MNTKEKRAKFRELVKDDRIKIASRFAEELAQPYLPFLTDGLTGYAGEEKRPARAWSQSGGRQRELRAD
jgi:hypothetical protein